MALPWLWADDAALELGPFLGDQGGRLLDDDADVGRRVDDPDGAGSGAADEGTICGGCCWCSPPRSVRAPMGGLGGGGGGEL